MLATALIVLTAGCLTLGTDDGPTPAETLADAPVEPWPGGQQLFTRDPDWRGGDGAQTVTLGEDRILWLFGDSLVEQDQPAGEDEVVFVHNSVAIQNGTNPARATFDAHWRTVETAEPAPPETPVIDRQVDPRPTAFFPNESDDVWHWPGAGALVEDQLVVFASRVQQNGTGAFGFEAAGWRVFTIDNPQEAPPRWEPDKHAPDVPDHGFTVGIAAVEHGEHLYAYATREAERGELTVHEVAVARWPTTDVAQARFDRIEWWTGDATGWRSDPSATPEVLVASLAASFTVHHDPGTDRFVFTGLEGFPRGPITVRTAPDPWGPFSERAELFTPPGQEADGGTYAARAHPGLAGGETIVTWHDARYPTPRMARAPPVLG